MSYTESDHEVQEDVLTKSESDGDVDVSEAEEKVVRGMQNVSCDEKYSVFQGNYVEDGIDDSALNCCESHHSDKDEETSHVSVFTGNVIQDLNHGRSFHANEDFKKNSQMDQVEQSSSENHLGKSVPNSPLGSVMAAELSLQSFSDGKPSTKPSKFRELWAKRNSNVQKIGASKSLQQASSPAEVASERLQKFAPLTDGSESEPGNNWRSRLRQMSSGTSLPSVELAVHMGLYRTHVGYITPATGTFKLLANVRNHLYWDECKHELTPAFDEALPSDRVVINFERDLALMKERRYDFVLCQQKFSWDLQDVLSLFLVCLKRKAEMDLKMEFNACVVAVPQFFNESQRVQVQQSAVIAGFDTVTLVNDTTAIAVVHVVDNEAVTGNVVVVNTHEGPVDVASFAFDHGRLECRGITGYYFFDDQTGFWSALMGSVKELIIGYPANSSEMFFTKKQLGISPSSLNTRFLLLGEGENHDLCSKAIRKAAKYANDETHDIQLESVVHGTAYICCLRSRDPCNPVLVRWQDKLQPSSKAIDNQVLDEVERKILKSERSWKNFNAVMRCALTPEELQHRRRTMLTSNKAFLHRDKLRIMELMNSMGESHVPSDDLTRLISTSVQKHFWTVITKLLTEEELNLDDLKRIKGEIKALRKVVQTNATCKH